MEQVENSLNKYSSLLKKMQEIHSNFTLTSDEMENVFNEKYKGNEVVQLLDEKGEALMDKSGKRVEPVEFEKINKASKERHIRGLLYKFTLNQVDLVDKLSEETALLEALKQKGVDLEQMMVEANK